MTDSRPLGPGTVAAALGAVIVVAASLGFMGWYSVKSGEALTREFYTQGSAAAHAVAAVRGREDISANDNMLLNRIVQADVFARVVTGRHTVTTLALTVAFSLLAIGFALFVIGAEGTFSFEGGGDERAKLALRATAPGLLCFTLAALVAIWAVSTGPGVNFTEHRTFPEGSVGARHPDRDVSVSPQPPPAPDAPPEGMDFPPEENDDLCICE